MKTDRISFTSKINFVSGNIFDKLKVGKYIDFLVPEKSILKADKFYTTGVRTCTAGGVMNSKTGEIAGFHIYDNLDNNENIAQIIDDVMHHVNSPDRALLLGSKDLRVSIFSIENFQKFKDVFLAKIKNVTLFEEHVLPCSESHMSYNSVDDTWIIQTSYKPLTKAKYSDVGSIGELTSNFRYIKLANGDSLYINDDNVII